MKRELADDSPEIYKRIPGEFLNEINRLKAETIGDKSPFGKLLRNTAQAEAEAISVARAWDERCGHEGGEKKAPLYIRDAQTAVQITIKTITEGLNELTSYKQKMEDFFQNCQIEIRRACGPLLDLALLRKTAALTELAQHLPQQVEQAILTSTTEIYSRITTIQQSLEKAYKETTDSVASENANSGNAEQDFSRITEQIKHFLKNKPALPEAPEIAA
ncbi:MAG TPA: hypothetical protein VFQ60_01565 [Patescibacteria group bacterium]|nr:hypothetical protein [Patescibacteria group bacterium]